MAGNRDRIVGIVNVGDNVTVDEEVITIKEMTYAANGALERNTNQPPAIFCFVLARA